jgi:biotin carboxylase
VPKENEQIRRAVDAVLRETGFSGFGCIDFMVHRETNTPYLIECNPFPVNVAHLGHVLGEDLCRALHHGLAHSASSLSEHQTEKESTKKMAIIFPYELIRDSESTHILTHSHDVPFDDPKLLKAMQERFGIPGSAIDRLQKSIGSC